METISSKNDEWCNHYVVWKPKWEKCHKGRKFSDNEFFRDNIVGENSLGDALKLANGYSK